MIKKKIEINPELVSWRLLKGTIIHTHKWPDVSEITHARNDQSENRTPRQLLLQLLPPYCFKLHFLVYWRNIYKKKKERKK